MECAKAEIAEERVKAAATAAKTHVLDWRAWLAQETPLHETGQGACPGTPTVPSARGIASRARESASRNRVRMSRIICLYLFCNGIRTPSDNLLYAVSYQHECLSPQRPIPAGPIAPDEYRTRSSTRAVYSILLHRAKPQASPVLSAATEPRRLQPASFSNM